MLKILERLFDKKTVEDVRIELPGVDVVFNHRLKVAFLYCLDSDTPDSAYVALEKHLAKYGYFTQIIVAPPGLRASDHRHSTGTNDDDT